MPATAAAQYWTQRERYRTALRKISAIDDEDIQQTLRQALTRWVRGNFRGISTSLTRRIGCRLSCLPDNYEGTIHVEHAVPLNLMHDYILGIPGNELGNLYDRFPTLPDIEVHVRKFVVGVLVTPDQHSLLDAWGMHGEWTWLADAAPWDWNDIDFQNWNYDERPLWLRSVMNRYESVPPPEGPLRYRPLSDFERQRLQGRRRR